MQQASGELWAHRAGKLLPGEGGGQVECLSLADLDRQVPVLRHAVEDNAAGSFALCRRYPDDLAEAHLREAGIRNRGHDHTSPSGYETILTHTFPGGNADLQPARLRDHRAINVPLTGVRCGISRLLTDNYLARSA